MFPFTSILSLRVLLFTLLSYERVICGLFSGAVSAVMVLILDYYGYFLFSIYLFLLLLFFF